MSTRTTRSLPFWMALLGVLFTVLGVAAPAQAAAVRPSVSPTVSNSDVHIYNPGGCSRGYFCAWVNDPTKTGFQVKFNFYSYGTYALSYWHGSGAAFNNQTGNACVTLLDRYHRAIGGKHCGSWSSSVSWEPVWYIRVSSS